MTQCVPMILLKTEQRTCEQRPVFVGNYSDICDLLAGLPKETFDCTCLWSLWIIVWGKTLREWKGKKEKERFVLIIPLLHHLLRNHRGVIYNRSHANDAILLSRTCSHCLAASEILNPDFIFKDITRKGCLKWSKTSPTIRCPLLSSLPFHFQWFIAPSFKYTSVSTFTFSLCESPAATRHLFHCKCDRESPEEPPASKNHTFITASTVCEHICEQLISYWPTAWGPLLWLDANRSWTSPQCVCHRKGLLLHI